MFSVYCFRVSIHRARSSSTSLSNKIFDLREFIKKGVRLAYGGAQNERGVKGSGHEVKLGSTFFAALEPDVPLNGTARSPDVL